MVLFRSAIETIEPVCAEDVVVAGAPAQNVVAAAYCIDGVVAAARIDLVGAGAVEQRVRAVRGRRGIDDEVAQRIGLRLNPGRYRVEVVRLQVAVEREGDRR